MYDSIFEYHFHQISIHFVDILLSFSFFLILILLSNLKQNNKLKIEGNSHYKYYTYNTIFKTSFALIFAGVYLLIYNGGDTVNYFHGATKLNNLFWESPIDYFRELLSTPSLEKIGIRYTPKTGYPDGGIYNEPESFFISKIYSILMFFTGQHYLTLTVFSGWIVSKISWKVFEVVLQYQISTVFMTAISILFIPSVAFWCSGISKDTIILIAVLFVLVHSFNLMNRKVENRFFSLFLIFVGFYVLYHTRSFMVGIVGLPLIIVFSTRLVKKYNDTPFFANAIRFTIVLFTFLSVGLVLTTQKKEIIALVSKYTEEAQVIQKDFANNKNYGNKKYDLGITDYSVSGIIKSAPLAITTAFYRPYIWEAKSIQLIVSGVETLLFLILTFLFLFKGSLLSKLILIKSNEFLIFALIFTLLLAFFSGFVSVLFGVLVRFKAPFLMFFVLILTINPQKK